MTAEQLEDRRTTDAFDLLAAPILPSPCQHEFLRRIDKTTHRCCQCDKKITTLNGKPKR